MRALKGDYNFMALKTIYFDLGNVLCFFSKAKMIGQLAACSGIEPRFIQKIFIEKKIQPLYEKGEITTQELHRIFGSIATKPLSYDLFMKAITNIFHPNTELWKVVEKLKHQGIRLVLLSNTCEGHYQWIAKNYPILNLFDKQILSFKVGLLKPDPRIFQKALEYADCKTEECFYVDDTKEHIESARTQGIDSELFTNTNNLKNKLIKKFNLSI